MNTTGFVKYAGALIALAICSACGALPLSLSKGQGDMVVAPSNAALNGTYVGRTLSEDAVSERKAGNGSARESERAGPLRDDGSRPAWEVEVL